MCHHWPLHTPSTPTGGLADRWQRRQEVSDWVTLNKHWQLPDGWIWLTSVPHISAARDPQPVSQHLAPGSLFSVFLLLCQSFSFPHRAVRALTLLLPSYLPLLCPCITNVQVNIFMFCFKNLKTEKAPVQCEMYFWCNSVDNQVRECRFIWSKRKIRNIRGTRNYFLDLPSALQAPQVPINEKRQRVWVEEKQNKKSTCQMK